MSEFDGDGLLKVKVFDFVLSLYVMGFVFWGLW